MQHDCLSVTGCVSDVDFSVEPPEILVEPQLVCAGCRGCLWRAAPVVRIPSSSAHAYRRGDRVTLMLPAPVMLAGAFALYGLPLLALGAGTLLGWALDRTGDAGPMLGALCGLGLAAFGLARRRTLVERKMRDALIVIRSG
jgi:positive regulator of sigma E activity